MPRERTLVREHQLGAPGTGKRPPIAVVHLSGAEDDAPCPPHHRARRAQHARARGAQKLHTQICGQKYLIEVEHGPACTAHRSVEQGRDESTLHHVAITRREAVLGGRGPLDCGGPRLPSDTAVTKRSPDVRTVDVGLFPRTRVKEPLARSYRFGHGELSAVQVRPSTAPRRSTLGAVCSEVSSASQIPLTAAHRAL